MAKRIFISFNFHERNFRDNLTRFFQEFGGPVQATPVFVERDVTVPGRSKEENDKAIEAEIRRLMQGCRGLIAVVGRDAHNSPWIDHELREADRLKIPKIAVKHPTFGGGVPNAHKYIKVVEWDPAAIARIVQGW